MYICITGFLPDNNVDDSLKFELYIDQSYNDQIVEILGCTDLNEMAEGLADLSLEQIERISQLTGENLPRDLQLLIGVEC